MRAITAFAALASLSACATFSSNPEKSAVVTGNEVSVVVNNVWNANQALPLADKHCGKYGKAARAVTQGEYSFSFDCVKP